VARDFLLLEGEGGKYSHLDVARDFLLLEGEGENIVILMWRGISFSLREKGKNTRHPELSEGSLGLR